MSIVKEQYVWALLRFTLGFIFLWAFFDKLFGLGFATSPDKSWLAGASPTFGFLKMGTHGPLVSFYQSIAGNIIVDWLFMAGLLLIGSSLVLGMGLKVAGYSGTLLMLLMWSAAIPPKNNPILDEHIIYILVLLLLANVKSGYTWGLGKWWSNTALVKRYKFLE